MIVPTRNRLHFLREAVGSVLTQTHPRWELLVIDAASTDGTVGYLASLGDARIRVLAGEAGETPSRLRNRALAEARGRWLAFLDSDDAWEPRKLELHLARLAAAPGVRWSYSAVSRMDAVGAPILDPRIQPWHPRSGRILRDLLAMDALVATPAVVAERGLVEEAGGFDEALAFCEDYDLWIRLAARSAVLALPEPLARVRVHDDSYSSDRAAVHGGWVRLYEKVAGEMGGIHPDLARLCRARRRHHAITRADLLARQGDRRRAFGEIVAVLLRSPASLRSWRVLVEGTMLNRFNER